MNKGIYLIATLCLAVSFLQLALILNLLGISPEILHWQNSFKQGDIFVAGESVERSQEPKDRKEFLPERIVIKKINLDLPIIMVHLKNGTWEVHEKVANYAQGTSLVNNYSGNVGLFGHNKADAFTYIRKLRPGDIIIVSGSGFSATYRVKSAEVVKPGDIKVFEPTEEPTLTLLTCTGFFSEKRFIVKAGLLEIKEIYEKS